jgi:hypothetical protein
MRTGPWVPGGATPGRWSWPAGLRGLRIARRPFGTGTRVLLDRLLADAGIPPASVTWEDFGIVLSGDALPAAGPLITALRDPHVQSAVTALGGYDLSQAGAVRLLG